MNINDVIFLVCSALVVLLSIRQFYMSRAIRILKEENFDLRFALEVAEAKAKGSFIEVHPYIGDKT